MCFIGPPLMVSSSSTLSLFLSSRCSWSSPDDANGRGERRLIPNTSTRGNSCTTGCFPNYCSSMLPLKAANSVVPGCATTLRSSRGIMLSYKNSTTHQRGASGQCVCPHGPWEVLSAEQPVSHSTLLSHAYHAPGVITVRLPAWKWKAHGDYCVLLSLLVPSTGPDFPLRGGDRFSQRLQWP